MPYMERKQGSGLEVCWWLVGHRINNQHYHCCICKGAWSAHSSDIGVYTYRGFGRLLFCHGISGIGSQMSHIWRPENRAEGCIRISSTITVLPRFLYAVSVT